MSDLRSRPNVVFVLTDDQGYGDLSCLGNPVLHTPSIDRLHSQSVRFTDFHVAPVCTPTRGELLTGRDALCNGATFVCMGRSLLRADLPTVADIFAANGYHTGHFGKWHLGDNYPYRPQDRGFHETVYHPAWGITSAPDYFGNDYFDDRYRHRDEIEQYDGYWREGRPSGLGMYKYANGGELSGSWDKGRLVAGKGTYIFENGDKYEGEWRSDMMWGRGTYITAGGKAYGGAWRSNRLVSPDGKLAVPK